MKFRASTIILVVCLAVAMSDVGHTLEGNKQVSLILKVDKPQYSPADDIILQVTLENVGNAPVTIPAVMMPDDHGLKLVVVNDKGQQEQLLYEYKLKWLNKTINLLPGYVWGRSYNLREMYKLGKGKYRARATYSTHGAKTMFRLEVDPLQLESSTVEINVVE